MSDFVVLCDFGVGRFGGGAAIYEVISRVFSVVAEEAFGVSVNMRAYFAFFIVHIPKAPAGGESVEKEAEELGSKVVRSGSREFGVVGVDIAA